MYFYVDESGQTGSRLFDENQPSLYYGMLRSKVNIDLVAKKHVLDMRSKLGVERLHANHLGNGQLLKIVKDVETVRKKFDIRFDFYKIVKKDHAIISFFDQIFDQGMNPAVPWAAYWTPLRYVLLIKMAYLLNQDDLEKSWEARMTINNEKSEKLLVEVCENVLGRVGDVPDLRSREIIRDSLKWAIKNPSKISYNVDCKDSRKQISPNLIGFQCVMHGIATHLKKNNCKAKKIVVDRQSEFNSAQELVADYYRNAKGNNFSIGPGLPEMEMTHIPDIPIVCSPGDESAGLELVDIYLWVFKRVFEKKAVAQELLYLFNSQLKRGHFDEVSLKAIEARWAPLFMNLPDLSEEDFARAKEFKRLQEERRKPYVVK